jgi:Fe-S cluster assembly protein SufD
MSDLFALADRRPSGGPPWLDALRRNAGARAIQTGLPTTKHEAWRFTSVAKLAQIPFEAAPAANTPFAVDSDDDGADRVVVVDGSPRIGRGIAGVDVVRLRDAWDMQRIARALEDTTALDHFAALNTAQLSDGLAIVFRADERIERPLHVVHVATPVDAPTMSHPRLVVIVERGAEARLIESYEIDGRGTRLTNAVTDVVIEGGAGLEHTRVVFGAAGGHHLGAVSVRQDRDTRYVSRVATIGGALSRVDVGVRLEAPGAECTLDGIYMADDGEHVDHHTVVDHVAPYCTSHEQYRGIVGGKGRAVWDATAVVHKDAQRSSAHQENRNLMLSDDAVVHTKPHLRIDADDVKCSHGATIGTLDKDQLFYLRARGLTEPLARALLTYAFVEAMVDRIPLDSLRTRLSGAILERLPEGGVVREVLCQS